MDRMNLKEALDITVELARENILKGRQCDNEDMLADRVKQLNAVDRVYQAVEIAYSSRSSATPLGGALLL